jgi:cell division protein FtsL
VIQVLTETAVSALLTASITGAGLVLAVYTLIIPLSRRFFSYRAEEVHEKIQELKEKIDKTNTRVSADELREMKAMVEGIEEQQAFPTYLGLGAGVIFLGYIVFTVLSFFWLIDYSKQTADSWLPFAFLISTILFLLLGLFSVKDISQTMKREFETLKEEVEETKGRKAFLKQLDRLGEHQSGER